MAPNASVKVESAAVRYMKESDSVSIGSYHSLTEFDRPTAMGKMLAKLKKSKRENAHSVDYNSNFLPVSKSELSEFAENDNEASLHCTEDIAKSEIISHSDFECIASYLPASTFGKKLDLIYSSIEHGTSLKTLYRKCKSWSLVSETQSDLTPCLIVVSDSEGHVFGLATSGLPRVSGKRFLGNGESFLFKLRPELNIHRWTGLNEYFLNCGNDYMSAGGSADNAASGMWIDEELKFGRSSKCETFNNEVLSSREDFEIYGVEVWGFVV